MNFLSHQQQRLLEFCKVQHGAQVRKYTGEPYWNHLVAVARRVSEFEPIGVEVALCHDLLEDTPCTKQVLLDELQVRLGYSKVRSDEILEGVVDLTDVYTHEAFPQLNRKVRKEKEAIRLGKVQPLSQSVKYADLIDNATSIIEHDPGFGRKFLGEMLDILDHMRDGNIHLLIQCCEVWSKETQAQGNSKKLNQPR